jgi:hypothetical protein
MNKSSLLNERVTMRILSSLALACAVLCCGCSTAPAIPDAAIPDSGALQAEPRGIVGEVCPPALAAKGYC